MYYSCYNDPNNWWGNSETVPTEPVVTLSSPSIRSTKVVRLTPVLTFPSIDPPAPTSPGAPCSMIFSSSRSFWLCIFWEYSSTPPQKQRQDSTFSSPNQTDISSDHVFPPSLITAITGHLGYLGHLAAQYLQFNSSCTSTSMKSNYEKSVKHSIRWSQTATCICPNAPIMFAFAVNCWVYPRVQLRQTSPANVVSNFEILMLFISKALCSVGLPERDKIQGLAKWTGPLEAITFTDQSLAIKNGPV